MLLAALNAKTDKTPGLRAVGDVQGWLTYAETALVMEQIRTCLSDGRIRAGEIVAISASHDKLVVPLISALWDLGAAYVPVDPLWPDTRMRWVLHDADVRVYIGFGEDDCAKIGSHDVDIFDVISMRWLRNSRSTVNRCSPGLAYVLYTSGSTGTPKGVEMNLASVEALINRNLDWSPLNQSDTAMCFHSLTFDASVWELFRAPMAGASLYICDRSAQMSPASVLETIISEHITHLSMTPTAFRMFSAHAIKDERPLPLQHIILGGEKVDFRELVDWFSVFPDTSPCIWNGYGPTEACVYATTHQIRKIETSNDSPSLIGSSLGHVKVSLADPGQVSEIRISGVGVARGYRNAPELTNEVFVESDDFREYRTGDMGYLTDGGEIAFVGRRDSQVKLHGYRIELEEIEYFMRQHPDVVDCVADVVIGPDSLRSLLVAGVSVSQKVSDRKLRLYIADLVPRFTRPARIVFLDHIPLLSSGKIDRRASHLLLEESINSGQNARRSTSA